MLRAKPDSCICTDPLGDRSSPTSPVAVCCLMVGSTRMDSPYGPGGPGILLVLSKKAVPACVEELIEGNILIMSSPDLFILAAIRTSGG